jgi:hypothetical protein
MELETWGSDHCDCEHYLLSSGVWRRVVFINVWEEPADSSFEVTLNMKVTHYFRVRNYLPDYMALNPRRQ